MVLGLAADASSLRTWPQEKLPEVRAAARGRPRDPQPTRREALPGTVGGGDDAADSGGDMPRHLEARIEAQARTVPGEV